MIPELAEAAAKTGHPELVAAALTWVTERARHTPTGWALGMEARVRALHREGHEAEDAFRESIERLDGTGLRYELARSRLLYGEWLRGEGRPSDAREQLRTAHRMLAAMGVNGFAERARRELAAAGEVAAVPGDEGTHDLTAQETTIARLAASGSTNPEIGAQLFLSPRTVEWHLHKVYDKLEITSRRQLRQALPAGL